MEEKAQNNFMPTATRDETHRLTKRQKMIFDYIADYVADNGAPPTRMEIANAFGFKSPNASEDHLKALEKKGFIRLQRGASRGIRILVSTPRLTAQANQSSSQSTVLPIIGKVAAGFPILAQENVDHYHTLSNDLFKAKPDYLLVVSGLSMINAGILENDLLAVRKSSEANNGDIVVARINDEVTVKRFQRSDNHIQLLPENDKFQPIDVVPGQDDFSIEGQVVGVIRREIENLDN